MFGINQNDLHNRVVNQLENNLKGENVFGTGTYTGETDFGYLVGQGTFKFNSGSIYEGQFANNQFEGLGTLKVPSEGTYVGSFLNSEKSGNGIFTWEDGTVYDGEWKYDQMTGQGTYTTPDNVKYIGTFDYNCFKEGKCTFTNETGTYSLEYKDFTSGAWVLIQKDVNMFTDPQERNYVHMRTLPWPSGFVSGSYYHTGAETGMGLRSMPFFFRKEHVRMTAFS